MFVFETERLTIRKLSISDVDALLPVVTDEKTMKYTACGVLKPSEVTEFIEQCIAKYETPGFGYWVVEHKDSKCLIGLCGLNRHLIDDTEYLHLNYRLATAFLGKGYATEVTKGMQAYCHVEQANTPLYAIIELSNIDSIKVAQRSGFEFELTTEFKGLQVNIYKSS